MTCFPILIRTKHVPSSSSNVSAEYPLVLMTTASSLVERTKIVCDFDDVVIKNCWNVCVCVRESVCVCVCECVFLPFRIRSIDSCLWRQLSNFSNFVWLFSISGFFFVCVDVSEMMCEEFEGFRICSVSAFFFYLASSFTYFLMEYVEEWTITSSWFKKLGIHKDVLMKDITSS